MSGWVGGCQFVCCHWYLVHKQRATKFRPLPLLLHLPNTISGVITVAQNESVFISKQANIYLAGTFRVIM